MANIVAVCTSSAKGTRKKTVSEGTAEKNFGLLGDAHDDPCTHHQVSLLAVESIEKMRGLGLDVGPGDFAENLTTKGTDLLSLPIGTNLTFGDSAVLELIQFGKECYSKCATFRQVDTCVIPKEGVFAKVIHGGVIRAGDTIGIQNVG